MYLSHKQLIEKIKDFGYTQSEIADKLNVSQSAVSQMLRGDSNMVSLAVRFLESEGYEVEGGYYKVNSN